MHHRRFVTVVLAAALAAATGAAWAAPYTLDQDTTYSEGCVPPCRCPVVVYQDTSGGFDLRFDFVTQEGYFLAVEDFHVTAIGFDGEVVHEARGQGTYFVSRSRREHEMTLELSVDGGEVQRYTSGLVARTNRRRDIDITVSLGTECFDVWIGISSRPE